MGMAVGIEGPSNGALVGTSVTITGASVRVGVGAMGALVVFAGTGTFVGGTVELVGLLDITIGAIVGVSVVFDTGALVALLLCAVGAAVGVSMCVGAGGITLSWLLGESVGIVKIGDKVGAFVIFVAIGAVVGVSVVVTSIAFVCCEATPTTTLYTMNGIVRIMVEFQHFSMDSNV